jgi:hypothetical protein
MFTNPGGVGGFDIGCEAGVQFEPLAMINGKAGANASVASFIIVTS